MKEIEPEVQFAALPRQEHAAQVGMWVFLATETLFMGVLFAAYALVRINHPHGFALGSRETDVMLGTTNTAVLLTSSLSMALAVLRIREGAHRASAFWLVITASLGLVFLGIKGVEYWTEWQHSLVPGLKFHTEIAHAHAVELFYIFYFVMTGAHAIHLSIGICLVFLFAFLTRRGRFTPEYRAPVENLGLYWHFVDIVWIFLYPILYLIQRT